MCVCACWRYGGGTAGHKKCMLLSDKLARAIKANPDWVCITCKICSVCQTPGHDVRVESVSVHPCAYRTFLASLLSYVHIVLEHRPSFTRTHNANNIHSQDQLLFCDSCDQGVHFFCMDPPVTQAPEGDWECPECLRGTGHVLGCRLRLSRSGFVPSSKVFFKHSISAAAPGTLKFPQHGVLCDKPPWFSLWASVPATASALRPFHPHNDVTMPSQRVTGLRAGTSRMRKRGGRSTKTTATTPQAKRSHKSQAATPSKLAAAAAKSAKAVAIPARPVISQKRKGSSSAPPGLGMGEPIGKRSRVSLKSSNKAAPKVSVREWVGGHMCL